MRIVMFARVPAWYAFRQDRLAQRFESEGHTLAGIVAEKTGTLATLREWMHKLGPRVVVQKAAKRLAGRIRGRSAHAAQSQGIAALPLSNARIYRVASHNSDECVRIVRELRPDVIVLRGCRVIRKDILQVPAIGTINPHYAILPAYRGMEVTEWSVLHGDPCAVSVHWVSEVVDTGAVITSRPVEVYRGDSLGGLREKCATLAVELLAQALHTIEEDKIRPVAVTAPEGRQYFAMHHRLRALAAQRLRVI